MYLHSVFIVSILCATALGRTTQQLNDERVLYEQFKRQYNKVPSNAEDDMRFKIFRNNLKRIDEFIKDDQGTAEYGITEFSDLTEQEFADLYTNSKFPVVDEKEDLASLKDLPEAPVSVDWRLKGAVGPVLNQRKCGSCWAFSVVGNIEGQWFRKTGKLLTLSKQQLVDCDGVDHGCYGGFPLNTYKEVKRLGGLMLESDYPYIARQKLCQMNRTKNVVFIDDSEQVKMDEKYQAAFLATNGPLSSGVNAKPLQFYKRGIVHPWWFKCLPFRMNHAVLTVGYGIENGKPYWLVKNSWGTTWGEEGYFRINRGGGTCGINWMATTAVIH